MMKRIYQSPIAEKMEFDYTGNVVASPITGDSNGDNGPNVTTTDVGCNREAGKDNPMAGKNCNGGIPGVLQNSNNPHITCI